VSHYCPESGRVGERREERERKREEEKKIGGIVRKERKNEHQKEKREPLKPYLGFLFEVESCLLYHRF
jgi:hypothetical protein